VRLDYLPWFLFSVLKGLPWFARATRHAQACADRSDRVEPAGHRSRKGRHGLVRCVANLLIHLWVLLTVFAGRHVGMVPRRGSDAVAHFETSMHEIEELHD
jgi:hypothetical protein